MKILIYSDLHLELNNPFTAINFEADIMILAGDIIIFKDFRPLKKFLVHWNKPVLFIAGNHEYWAKKSIIELESAFKKFICAELSLNFHWLRNSSFALDDIKFFGGTMWTDFNKSNPLDMMFARRGMRDYEMIRGIGNTPISPESTVDAHEEFKKKLIAWLEENKDKKRVVISHHAPCINPKSIYKASKLQAAFNSLDMVEIIEKYQPELWIYGHTHEPDDQMIGKTRIISNPFGYYGHAECREFNPELVIEV